jgi:hypothetical protein
LYDFAERRLHKNHRHIFPVLPMSAVSILNRLAGASAGLGVGAFLLNESLYNGTCGVGDGAPHV